jgi:hypothetical protein
MKKLTIFAVCLMLLGMGVSAKNDKNKVIVNFDTYSTHDGDFQTKFWKEMFKGGAPGQPGNTLMATGQGFIFKKAKIDENGAIPDGDAYLTTYIGGELILNSSGPWLNKKKLKATKLIANNRSTMNQTTGVLNFEMTILGKFDKEDVYFGILVEYEGEPQLKVDEYGAPVFQRGYDYDVTIEISSEPVTEPPQPPGEPSGGRVNFGEYSTCEGDFNTKFWKEMFKGGGPGQPGNTLKALGDGFIFKQAKIAEGGVVFNADGSFTTTYVGGVLVMNSSGPWLRSGKLKAVDVTATNNSFYDPVTHELDFVLTIEGQFLHNGYYFKAVAWWDGVPEMRGDRDGEYVFQRGRDFDVRIVIDDEEITEDLNPGCVD